MKHSKYYITTAIAYASRKPHFGNTYEIIMADAFTRFQRQIGKDAFLCTGTDEHGQKIENYAKEAGVSPKEYVDGVAGEIRGIWDLMNTSYDHFIRTTDESHVTAVRKIFTRFVESGDIYLGHYNGWYCTPCESFFTNSQVVDGKCPDCGRPVGEAQEEAYFFRMSKYAPRLIEHIQSHPGFIEPRSREKEMLNNFLLSEEGLQDLCVSRSSFTWGIPVDVNPKHVIYVWLDALSNYITAIGYDPDKSYEEQSEAFRALWPAKVHIIGKDILRFHTIYWPIFLMALGLPLPEKIFGHPWFNATEERKGGVGGAEVKMSKSRGNVIYADELAQLFSVDGVRYYALSEMPYDQDGHISYYGVLNRYNTDLANNLGNLVSRTHAMTVKYFDGVIPTPGAEEGPDTDLKATVTAAVKASHDAFDTFRIADGLAEIFSMLRRANKYIDETTPWALAKDENQKARLGTVLYNLLETIRTAAVLLTPMLPTTAEKIFASLATDMTSYDTVDAFGALVSGVKLGESSPLFARIDEKVVDEIVARREAEAEAKAKAAEPIVEPEHEAEIKVDAFGAVELRVAKVIACEPVKKAKKLLKLQVDLGYETRQIVSGIARFYSPEDLIGKKVIIVANLAPATLCGVESRGMLLASGEEDVHVVFVDDSVKLGERIH